MNPQFWNERYREEAFAYGKEPNDFLRAEAHHIPRGRVLCLAEGQGRNAVFLAGLGHEVVALDYAEEGLRRAEALAEERGVTIATKQADLSTYEPEASAFDGIVSIFGHLPPAVRKRVHGWVAKALRPGGVFLLEAYTPAQLAHDTGGPKDASLLMSLEALRGELAPLELEIAREVEREVSEGAYHRGRSATVQVVARRR